MIHAVELDSQTSSFVRQLEEQRRIEKNLMVERVRSSKEGLESVFHDIKERVDALERMTNSVSTSFYRAHRLESVDLRRDGRFVCRSDHGVR
jgi:molecular chaperone GrpE (heat shock protein)